MTYRIGLRGDPDTPADDVPIVEVDGVLVTFADPDVEAVVVSEVELAISLDPIMAATPVGPFEPRGLSPASAPWAVAQTLLDAIHEIWPTDPLRIRGPFPEPEQVDVPRDAVL